MPGASIPLAAPRSSLTPAFSMSSAAIPPGLSTRTPSASTFTMVDSSPTGVAPPSTIRSSRPPRSASTACALVAVMRPDVLALGAASGLPNAAIRSCAKPPGMRNATVSNPAETSGWIGEPALSGSTSVSGPGQKASASLREIASNSASPSAISMSATWAISGLKRGRPLASKMRATAAPSVASPAKP